MRTQYSTWEFICNVFDFFKTKLLWPEARLIRHPFYCRGKHSMQYKKGFTTGRNCRFDMPGNKITLTIGENFNIGDNNHIVAYKSVKIGDNCLLASKVFISDTNHGVYDNSDSTSIPEVPPNVRNLISKEVVIGNNVWIGENVVILAGAMIGDGCIIGANSLITKSIPANSIVVGTNQIIKLWHQESGKWVEKDNL